MSKPKLNIKEESSTKKTRSPPKKAKVEQSVPRKKKLKTDAEKTAEKAQHLRFGKAELTASCASVVDFGLAFFLSDIVGIYYGLANALGVISGGITNCILNYRYVFGDSKSKKKSVAWRYFIIWGISWMLNSGGTIALTEFLNAHEHIQLHYMIPKSIVSLLVAIFVNYPGQKKFVFKQ